MIFPRGLQVKEKSRRRPVGRKLLVKGDLREGMVFPNRTAAPEKAPSRPEDFSLTDTKTASYEFGEAPIADAGR